MRCGLRSDGFHRKRSADVGSRVDNEAAVGRPRWIDRVLGDKRNGGATVDRHAEKVWDAVIVRRRGDRLAVGRPCWRAPEDAWGSRPRLRGVWSESPGDDTGEDPFIHTLSHSGKFMRRSKA